MNGQVTPLQSLQVIKHIIPAYKLIPNSSALKKPLLIYRSVFPQCSISAIEKHLRETDVVEPQWTYTMFKQSHFHSTTHEVLVIANGEAKLCFGHEDNHDRVLETAKKGDAIIIPAGVSHRLIEDLSGDFLMVGSYPKGKNWDMCYGHQDEAEKIHSIAALPWFQRDPIYGDKGPVLQV